MMPYYAESHATLSLGDCRALLAPLPAASVHTCVTSPPPGRQPKVRDL
jgi:DNA modification methylase